MFVSFTKTLKKMSGFRLGFGVRVNKRIYKIYYYLFKGIAVGCKKLYQLIKGKTAAPSEASVEPPKE